MFALSSICRISFLKSWNNNYPLVKQNQSMKRVKYTGERLRSYFFLLESLMLIRYYLVINLITFLVWGFDKWRAQNQKWRVSERILFSLIIIGGAIGALAGMQIFRHKTRKTRFWVIGILAALLHIAIYIYFSS